MVNQTTGEIIGYTDVYRLLRHGEDELGNNFEKAILEGVIFERYTGLKDNNGKEIYEGDIIHSDHFDTYYEVFFGNMEDSDCDGYLYLGWAVKRRYGEPLSLDDFTMDEVVGNIHENPELLGGEE